MRTPAWNLRTVALGLMLDERRKEARALLRMADRLDRLVVVSAETRRIIAEMGRRLAADHPVLAWSAL